MTANMTLEQGLLHAVTHARDTMTLGTLGGIIDSVDVTPYVHVWTQIRAEWCENARTIGYDRSNPKLYESIMAARGI